MQRMTSPAARRPSKRAMVTTITIPAARRRGDYTIYECPDCGERLHGEQRCDDCGRFARRVGLGGSCPHCDEPVAVSDLLDQEAILVTRQ